jgi:hypothetical protein
VLENIAKAVNGSDSMGDICCSSDPELNLRDVVDTTLWLNYMLNKEESILLFTAEELLFARKGW